MRLPARKVASADDAAMPPARAVEDIVGGDETLDRFGDEALVEAIARRIDFRLARAARRFRLPDDALPGLAERFVAKECARRKRASAS